MQYIAALIRFDKYPFYRKGFKYGTPKSRYEHRFAPFCQLLQPVPVPFDTFESTMLNEKISPEQMLNSAMTHFQACEKAAQKALDPSHQPKVEFSSAQKQFLQMCASVSKASQISITLFIMTMQKRVPAQSSQHPTFDFSYSKFYPVVKTV